MSDLIYRRPCEHGCSCGACGIAEGYGYAWCTNYTCDECDGSGFIDLVLDPVKVLITNPDEFHFIEAKDVLDVLDREAT